MRKPLDGQDHHYSRPRSDILRCYNAATPEAPSWSDWRQSQWGSSPSRLRPSPLAEMIDIHLQWKIRVGLLADSNARSLLAPQRNKRMFNVRCGNSFLKRIGGDLRSDLKPVVLEPTSLFHDAIRRLCIGAHVGKKFPYLIGPGLRVGPAQLSVGQPQSPV